MGSSLKSKSTRVRTARSVRPSPSPRSTPPRERSAVSQPQHPEAPPPSSGFLLGAALASIRGHLETLHAVAEVAYAALQAQSADVDRPTAIVLQRCVLDPLAEEIQRIERLIGGGSTS